jgi:hypothetical protein
MTLATFLFCFRRRLVGGKEADWGSALPLDFGVALLHTSKPELLAPLGPLRYGDFFVGVGDAVDKWSKARRASLFSMSRSARAVWWNLIAM